MATTGYDFTRDDFPALLIRKFYPERTDKESAVIRDYLLEHLADYDRVSFSVRVGQGAAPLAGVLPAVQKAFAFSSQKRIDVVGYIGRQVYLVEAKQRVTHAALGQLLTDRQLWMEDHPEGVEPVLVAIGRESDDETLRVLNDHGITVYLYPATVAQ